MAGELDHEEIETFERRLANDQAAREAVADAVKCTQAVQLTFEAEPVTPAKSTSPQRANAWWLGAAMGAAACLLIMLGLQQVQQDDDSANLPGEEINQPEAQDDGALAERWSELRQSEFVVWDDVNDADVLDGELPESISDWELDEDPHESSAPDWMMAAVSAAKKNQDMTDDMDMERNVDGPIEQ
mgnify:FL=1